MSCGAAPPAAAQFENGPASLSDMGLAHTKEEAKLSDWNSVATEEVPELYKFLQNPDASSYLALLPHELLKVRVYQSQHSEPRTDIVLTACGASFHPLRFPRWCARLGTSGTRPRTCAHTSTQAHANRCCVFTTENVQTIENCVHHGRYVLSVDQVKPRPDEVQRCARARDLRTDKIVWSSQYHVWMRAVCVAPGGLVYTLAGSNSSSQLAGHVWRVRF